MEDQTDKSREALSLTRTSRDQGISIWLAHAWDFVQRLLVGSSICVCTNQYLVSVMISNAVKRSNTTYSLHADRGNKKNTLVRASNWNSNFYNYLEFNAVFVSLSQILCTHSNLNTRYIILQIAIRKEGKRTAIFFPLALEKKNRFQF